jgi:putative hydrolase
MPTKPTNLEISNLLSEIADRLSHQKANPYRVSAYRNAASKVRRMKRKLAEIADHDHLKELVALPTIGNSIANIIIEFVNTGSCQFLERISGNQYAESIFDEIPGIGPHLSHLISSNLKIKSLEELKEATNDGRLDSIPGFGPKRVQLIQMVLRTMLDDLHKAESETIHERSIRSPEMPKVEILLRLDYLYRNKAQSGELHKLKPKNNNPERKAWLPIYHKELNEWNFTCMYSNTSRAHELGKTKDWVIIYYEKDGKEGQCTVVTEIRGNLSGHRMIRGRELECADFYSKKLIIQH